MGGREPSHAGSNDDDPRLLAAGADAARVQDTLLLADSAQIATEPLLNCHWRMAQFFEFS